MKAVTELIYLDLDDFRLGVAGSSEWPAGFQLSALCWVAKWSETVCTAATVQAVVFRYLAATSCKVDDRIAGKALPPTSCGK